MCWDFMSVCMYLCLTSSWLSGQLRGGHWPGTCLGNIGIRLGRTGNVIERAVLLMIGILSHTLVCHGVAIMYYKVPAPEHFYMNLMVRISTKQQYKSV